MTNPNLAAYAPLARIALRYLSGGLVTYGGIHADVGNMIASDPDVAQALLDLLPVALGGLVGIVTEAYYRAVKRAGGPT